MWACPACFPFLLLLLTEAHPPGESPLFMGPGRSDSAIFEQLPLSPLSSCPCPPGSCHPRHTMPVLKITTWHPERTPNSGYSPPPPHFWASFFAYPSPIPPSLNSVLVCCPFHKLQWLKGGRAHSPQAGPSSLSQSAQRIAMVPHWSRAVSSRKLPPIKL